MSKRTLFFDCFAGISGDMLVGALIDLGVGMDQLKRHLESLPIPGFEIAAKKVSRCGIEAVKFDVQVDEAYQRERHLSEILTILEGSSLPARARGTAESVFRRLADAEAKVHGTTPDKVHFHEVGAVDSIVDVICACIGFEILGVERFISSPLRVGFGSVEAAHGLLPVPAPGTAELLRGIPVYAGDTEGEFVTPTGAAILRTVCNSFGQLPPLAIERVGSGAGTRDPQRIPNVLRVFLGEPVDSQSPSGPSPKREDERILVLETNIDDMNPQLYDSVMQRAFDAGAIDVFLTPVHMKKNRPGVQVTLLCTHDRLDQLLSLLLTETTTLGVRHYEAARRTLARSTESVDTRYGPVRIKVASEGARAVHFQPEYDDCKRLADLHDVPVMEVQAAASAAYRRLRGQPGEDQQ